MTQEKSEEGAKWGWFSKRLVKAFVVSNVASIFLALAVASIFCIIVFICLAWGMHFASFDEKVMANVYNWYYNYTLLWVELCGVLMCTISGYFAAKIAEEHFMLMGLLAPAVLFVDALFPPYLVTIPILSLHIPLMLATPAFGLLGGYLYSKKFMRMHGTIDTIMEPTTTIITATPAEVGTDIVQSVNNGAGEVQELAGKTSHMPLFIKISWIAVSLFWILLVTRIVLPHFVAADGSFVVGLMFGALITLTMPVIFIATVLLFLHFFIAYRKESIKPNVILFIITVLTFLFSLSPLYNSYKLVSEKNRYQNFFNQISKGDTQPTVFKGKNAVSSISLGKNTDTVYPEMISMLTKDNYAYIFFAKSYSDATINYIGIVDISNPSTPIVKSSTVVTGSPLKVDQDKLYMSYHKGDAAGLTTFDVSDKENPKQTTTILNSKGNILDVYSNANFLYIIIFDGAAEEIHIFVIDKHSGMTLSDFNFGKTIPSGGHVDGKYLYLFYPSNVSKNLGPNKLSAIDITNPKMLNVIKTIDTDSEATFDGGEKVKPRNSSKGVAVSGNYMYLQSETNFYDPYVYTRTRITVVDITDGNTMNIVSKLEKHKQNAQGNLSISGNYLVSGGEIIDISNPASIKSIKSIIGFPMYEGSVYGDYFYNPMKAPVDNSTFHPDKFRNDVVNIYKLSDILSETGDVVKTK